MRIPVVEYGNMSRIAFGKQMNTEYGGFLEQIDTFRWVDLDKNMDTIMKTFAFMRHLVEALDKVEALHYETIEP